MQDSQTQDIEWDDIQSATDSSLDDNRQPYEEVSRRTFELLDKQGWCLWRCQLFDDQVITVVKDTRIFNEKVRFSDPLFPVLRYPCFTVEELHYLIDKSDDTVRMVYEVKKLAPAKILLDGVNDREMTKNE